MNMCKESRTRKPKCNTSASSNIYNEIISLVRDKVAEIIRRVTEAKSYSVIMDCTPDLSHTAHCSVICVTLSNPTTCQGPHNVQYSTIFISDKMGGEDRRCEGGAVPDARDGTSTAAPKEFAVKKMDSETTSPTQGHMG